MFDVSVTDGINADLDAITRRLTAEQRQLGRNVAKAARKALLASVRARRSGGLSFSGMNTKLGASTRVLAQAGGATVFLDAVPAGAWSIAQHGRSAIVAKRGSAIVVNGQPVASVRPAHGRPGLWDGAEGEIGDAVVDVLEAAYDTAFGV